MNNWGRKFSGLKSIAPGNKLIRFIIAGAFLFNTAIIDMAWAREASPVLSPVGAAADSGPGHSLVDLIKIPEPYGTIKETFKGSSDKLVIQIQDIHSNYEGQKNLANILISLIENHNLKVVLIEGGITDRDFSYLRMWHPLKERKEKAEKLLKEGVLTGEAYVNIATDYPLKFQGVEDRELYEKNMDTYLKAELFADDGLALVKRLGNVVDNLKRRIYNRTLKSFDKKSNAYHNEELGFSEYLKYLKDVARKNDLSIKEFKNFESIIRLVELEDKINFDKVEIERDELIKRLTDSGADRAVIERLYRKGEDFKEGKIDQTEFYNYLINLAKGSKTNLKGYKQLTNYVDYINVYASLDISRLFEDLNNVEDKLAQALCRNQDEKELIRISKNITILEKFMRLKLIPQDFAYFKSNKNDFYAGKWLDFLKSRSAQHKLTIPVPDDVAIIDNNIPTLEGFYQAAIERDNAFVKNSLAKMEKENEDFACLIAGGFHTQNLTQIFAQKGISYIIIAPKARTTTDDKIYKKELKSSYSNRIWDDVSSVLAQTSEMRRASAMEDRATLKGLADDDLIYPIERLVGSDRWAQIGPRVREIVNTTRSSAVVADDGLRLLVRDLSDRAARDLFRQMDLTVEASRAANAQHEMGFLRNVGLPQLVAPGSGGGISGGVGVLAVEEGQMLPYVVYNLRGEGIEGIRDGLIGQGTIFRVGKEPISPLAFRYLRGDAPRTAETAEVLAKAIRGEASPEQVRLALADSSLGTTVGLPEFKLTDEELAPLAEAIDLALERLELTEPRAGLVGPLGTQLQKQGVPAELAEAFARGVVSADVDQRGDLSEDFKATVTAIQKRGVSAGRASAVAEHLKGLAAGYEALAPEVQLVLAKGLISSADLAQDRLAAAELAETLRTSSTEVEFSEPEMLVLHIYARTILGLSKEESAARVDLAVSKVPNMREELEATENGLFGVGISNMQVVVMLIKRTLDDLFDESQELMNKVNDERESEGVGVQEENAFLAYILSPKSPEDSLKMAVATFEEIKPMLPTQFRRFVSPQVQIAAIQRIELKDADSIEAGLLKARIDTMAKEALKDVDDYNSLEEANPGLISRFAAFALYDEKEGVTKLVEAWKSLPNAQEELGRVRVNRDTLLTSLLLAQHEFPKVSPHAALKGKVRDFMGDTDSKPRLTPPQERAFYAATASGYSVNNAFAAITAVYNKDRPEQKSPIEEISLRIRMEGGVEPSEEVLASSLVQIDLRSESPAGTTIDEKFDNAVADLERAGLTAVKALTNTAAAHFGDETMAKSAITNAQEKVVELREFLEIIKEDVSDDQATLALLPFAHDEDPVEAFKEDVKARASAAGIPQNEFLLALVRGEAPTTARVPTPTYVRTSRGEVPIDGTVVNVFDVTGLNEVSLKPMVGPRVTLKGGDRSVVRPGMPAEVTSLGLWDQLYSFARQGDMVAEAPAAARVFDAPRYEPRMSIGGNFTRVAADLGVVAIPADFVVTEVGRLELEALLLGWAAARNRVELRIVDLDERKIGGSDMYKLRTLLTRLEAEFGIDFAQVVTTAELLREISVEPAKKFGLVGYKGEEGLMGLVAPEGPNYAYVGLDPAAEGRYISVISAIMVGVTGNPALLEEFSMEELQQMLLWLTGSMYLEDGHTAKFGENLQRIIIILRQI